jgi:hypothetical protein
VDGASDTRTIGAALPLVAAFVWLVLLHLWQAKNHSAPWLFPDEVQYTQIARSIAGVPGATAPGPPHSIPTLYTAVIAPAWDIGGVQTSYQLAKYVGVVAMLATMFPVYALARMLISRPVAVAAAVGSVLVPALAYSSILIQEPIAYPYFALCVLALTKALTVSSRRWVAAAGLLSAGAVFVRAELLVLSVAAVLATLAYLYGHPSVRARRCSRSTRTVLLGAAAIGVAAVALVLLVHYSHSWRVAVSHPVASVEYGAWALGAMTIGLGILPLIACLSALRRPIGRAQRSFALVFSATVLCLLVYTGAKAAYLSTLAPPLIEERNLIYLYPLILVGAAVWVERRAISRWALAGATALAFCLLVVTPYHLELTLNSDALGLSNLEYARNTLGLSADAIRVGVLLVAGASALAVLLIPRLITRPRLHRLLVALLATLVLAWNTTGELAASSASNQAADAFRHQLPPQPNWIDRAINQRPVLYLGRDLGDLTRVYSTEFWNTSVQSAWSIDGSGTKAAGLITPRIETPAGTLIPATAAGYVVTDPGVDVIGRLVRRQAFWRLYQITPPLRLADETRGVYQDGWMGVTSSYVEFAHPGEHTGWLDISLERPAWAARARPVTLTVKIGALRLIRGTPGMSGVDLLRRVTLRGANRITVTLRTPTNAFFVSLRASRTFTGADLGIADARNLSTMVHYVFTHPSQGDE